MSFIARLFGLKPKPEPRRATEEELRLLKEQYDASFRKASLAVLGKDPAAGTPLGSWFGGHGVKLPSEDIPVCEDLPMFPLLQVNCADLPYVPPALAGTALFVVWMNQEHMSVIGSANSETWCLREYASLDDLEPVTGISLPKKLKTLPVTWTLSETETPHDEDNESPIDYQVIPRELYWEDPAVDLLTDQYNNHEYTKIGGYPFLIQGGLDNDAPFVFQIGSETDANWSWMDAGILYFSKSPEGQWQIEDQCY